MRGTAAASPPGVLLCTSFPSLLRSVVSLCRLPLPLLDSSAPHSSPPALSSFFSSLLLPFAAAAAATTQGGGEMAALRPRQEEQLQQAVLLYLQQRFPQAAQVFKEEANIKLLPPAAGDRAAAVDENALSNRWAATARLQAKVTQLQQQVQQQREQLALLMAASSAALPTAAAAPAAPAAVSLRRGAQQQQGRDSERAATAATAAAVGGEEEEQRKREGGEDEDKQGAQAAAVADSVPSTSSPHADSTSAFASSSSSSSSASYPSSRFAAAAPGTAATAAESGKRAAEDADRAAGRGRQWGAAAVMLEPQKQQEAAAAELFGLPAAPAAYSLPTARLLPINALAAHPLLPHLVTAADDGVLRVYQIQERGGRLLKELRVHREAVHDVVFDPSGRWCASGSSDFTIRILDVQQNYTSYRVLQGHEDVVSRVQFCVLSRPSSSSSVFVDTFASPAAASFDPLQTAGSAYSSSSYGAAAGGWSGSSSSANPSSSLFIASCGRDGTVRLWSAAAGLCVRTFSAATSLPFDSSSSRPGGGAAGGREGAAGATAFSRGRVAGGAAAGEGGAGGGGAAGQQGLGRDSAWVRCVALPEEALKAAKVFASCGSDSRVVVWRYDLGIPVRELLLHHTHVVEDILFASARTLRLLHSHRQAPPPFPSSLLDEAALEAAEEEMHGEQHVLRVAGVVLFSASRDTTIKMADVAQGTVLQTFVGHVNWVRRIALHPAGTHLISCADDRSIRCWNVVSAACERVLATAHSQFVTCLGFSSAALRLFASGSLDGTVKVWRCSTDQSQDVDAQE